MTYEGSRMDEHTRRSFRTATGNSGAPCGRICRSVCHGPVGASSSARCPR